MIVMCTSLGFLLDEHISSGQSCRPGGGTKFTEEGSRRHGVYADEQWVGRCFFRQVLNVRNDEALSISVYDCSS